MPKYENYKCPVCKVQFTNDDDIVTCPECGTPHHRECYNLVEHCVNKGLHESGYSFLDSAEKVSEPIIPIKNVDESQYYIPSVPMLDDSQESQQESTHKRLTPDDIVKENAKRNASKGKIDDVEVADIEATIRTNIPRFLGKFMSFSKNKGKMSWNWSAFFFGSFYMLFRKMYMQGVAFFCATMAIIVGGEFAIMKYAPKYMEAIQAFAENADPSSITADEMNRLMSISDAGNAVKVVYIVLGIIICFRIIEAIFADYFYKKTVFNIIKKVEDKMASEEGLPQTLMVFGGNGPLNQNQMKRLYLGNKGGVSFFAPFAAYVAMYFLMNLL